MVRWSAVGTLRKAAEPVASDGARGDTEFARAGPSAEADSFAGRAGERRAVLSFEVLVAEVLVSGRSLTAGNDCLSVKLSRGCSADCPGPLEGGAVKS